MIPRHEMAPTGVEAEMAALHAGTIPALTTRRLKLSVPMVTDFDAYAEIVCTQRGAFVGGPMSREDGWYDFIQLASSWVLHGHGGWTVRETGDTEPLGFVLLGLEPGDQTVELGFLFREMAEGRSIAFEAATAMRDWAFATYNWASLTSYIHAENARSQALAKRMGALRHVEGEHNIPEGFHAYLHINPDMPQ